ncbi:hypothetical protein GUI12_01085 [Anaplasmataceae bacterium AB001_6]|nr:hypothetical protein GUI12_01085 [Anaplasmataceae bacterium AB001_6]
MNVTKEKAQFTKLSSEVTPYAFYYDSETVVTKNGELLFTVRLEEFYSYDSIRVALQKSLPLCEKMEMALWIQTVRTRIKKGDFVMRNDNDSIMSRIYEDFVQNNDSRRKFTNYLYITCISKRPKIFNKFLSRVKNLFIGFTARKTLEDIFAKERLKLQKIKENFMENMKQFNIKVLKVRDSVAEPSIYFDFLVSFANREYSLERKNLSASIVKDYKIAFGHNVFQIYDEEMSQSRYASLISLKEARVPKDMVDINNIFENEQEFIITEIIIFEENMKKAHSIYDEQVSMLNISDDDTLKESMLLKNFEKKDAQSGFCNNSLTITLFDYDIAKVDEKIHALMNLLSKCGFIVIRHDIFLENMYYSTFPGNFAYIHKMNMTTIYNTCILTDIGDYFSGLITGGLWGVVIAGFRTLGNRMNFFNFHGTSKVAGHMVITGNQGSGRSSLRNFLLSQSIMKIPDLQVVLIDKNIRGYVFSYAMGGKFLNFSDDKPAKYGFNPFAKINTDSGTRILRSSLCHLKDQYSGERILNDEELNNLIDDLKNLPDLNDMQSVKEALLRQGEKLDFFVNNPIFDKIFAPEERFLAKRIEGFNVHILKNDGNYFRFVMDYIVNSVFDKANGSPRIIGIAGSLLVDFFDFTYIRDLMIRASRLNCTILIVIESVNTAKIRENDHMIHEFIDTVVFFTSDIDKKMAHKISVTEQEMTLIEELQAYDRSFFLKQRDKSTIVRFDILDSKFFPLFVSDEESISLMWKSVKEAKEQNKDWIELFLDSKQQSEKI